MKFKSKPLEVEAFRFEKPNDKFHRWLRGCPTWFTYAYTTGIVQITIRADAQYVTIYQNGDVRTANAGDMIVRNDYGRIFPMGADEFNEAFIPDTQ